MFEQLFSCILILQANGGTSTLSRFPRLVVIPGKVYLTNAKPYTTKSYQACPAGLGDRYANDGYGVCAVCVVCGVWCVVCGV